jgi:hypothetical protein
MSTTSDDQPCGAEGRARESVEHLQAAARELIAAARAALDVAEDVVNDPERAASLVGALAHAGDVARRLAGTGAGGGAGPARGADGRGGGDRGDAEPRVERISVT